MISIIYKQKLMNNKKIYKIYLTILFNFENLWYCSMFIFCNPNIDLFILFLLGLEKSIQDFNSTITQFPKAMHESERTGALTGQCSE